MVISIANPDNCQYDIMLSISPYEPGELVTSDLRRNRQESV